MAELDIKDIWAKGKQQHSNSISIDIDNVVGKKSKSVLYWVKFILWIEFWINVVSFPIILWGTFREDLYADFKVINIITLIVILIYLVYYQFLIRKIQKFDYTDDVYSSLTRIYGYLKFYLLHYRVIVWVVVPLVFLVSGYLSYTNTVDSEVTIPLGSDKFYIFCGVMLFFCLIIVLIMHFLVNLIYGRKIKKLKAMIRELGS
ncbi:MAG: hypothetical protein WBA74_15255 [Cyclobacteriaceae bacterium]